METSKTATIFKRKNTKLYKITNQGNMIFESRNIKGEKIKIIRIVDEIV